MRTTISTQRLLTVTDFRQHLLDRHDLDTATWTVLADLKDAHDRLHATATVPIHRHPLAVRPRGRRVNFGDCACYLDCRQDSHSGRWHQHENEPCPIHPGAEVVG